jgi:hypothetical protein
MEARNGRTYGYVTAKWNKMLATAQQQLLADQMKDPCSFSLLGNRSFTRHQE